MPRAKQSPTPAGHLSCNPNGRLARGARRRMPHAFGARHSEQTERIGVAHVLLHGKGKLLDVFERFDMVRIDASLIKALLVERMFS